MRYGCQYQPLAILTLRKKHRSFAVRFTKTFPMANENLTTESVETAVEKSKIQQFIEKNKTAVIGGGIALLVAVGAGIYFSGIFSGDNAEANAEMAAASRFFESDSLDKALKGDGQNLGFERIIDEYGSTKAGNLAKYCAGVAYLKKGQTDKGIEMLESVNKGDNMVSVSAYMALGFAYEDKGNLDKAESAFEKAADAVGENEQTTPMVLMQQARILEAKKEYADAADIYEHIKRDFPKSAEAARVDKYLARATTLAGK